MGVNYEETKLFSDTDVKFIKAKLDKLKVPIQDSEHFINELSQAVDYPFERLVAFDPKLSLEKNREILIKLKKAINTLAETPFEILMQIIHASTPNFMKPECS